MTSFQKGLYICEDEDSLQVTIFVREAILYKSILFSALVIFLDLILCENLD